jgi:LCP family protein required for cell wall assembly
VKLLIVIGCAVLLVGSAGVLAINLGLASLDKLARQANLLGNGAATGQNLDGPLNLLIAGIDTRTSVDDGSHSDTIIVMHIPASHDRAYLISIPRDTSVTIPASPATGFDGGSYKVNAAFTFGSQNGGGDAGGFQLLAQTLHQQWGLTFNAGVIVNFDGFTSILQQLGGVDMHIDETVYSIQRGISISTGRPARPYNIDPDTGTPICSQPDVTFDRDPLACAIPGTRPLVYRKGNTHLAPADALDFVRARDGLVGDDYARQRHQVQFIKAVVTEVYHKGLSDPLKLSPFMTSMGKAFTFDGNGSSIVDWIFTLKDLNPNTLASIKMNGGQFVNYTGLAPDARQDLNQTSLDLLEAIRTDTHPGTDNVGAFIAKHPDWVAP